MPIRNLKRNKVSRFVERKLEDMLSKPEFFESCLKSYVDSYNDSDLKKQGRLFDNTVIDKAKNLIVNEIVKNIQKEYPSEAFDD